MNMFGQIIGNGANWFIFVMAILIGFAVALGYTDFIKIKKKDQGKS